MIADKSRIAQACLKPFQRATQFARKYHAKYARSLAWRVRLPLPLPGYAGRRPSPAIFPIVQSEHISCQAFTPYASVQYARARDTARAPNACTWRTPATPTRRLRVDRYGTPALQSAVKNRHPSRDERMKMLNILIAFAGARCYGASEMDLNVGHSDARETEAQPPPERSGALLEEIVRAQDLFRAAYNPSCTEEKHEFARAE